MKKILYMAGVLALASVVASCDYVEKNFEGAEEAARPTQVLSKEYTIAPGDISTMVNGLRSLGTAEGDAMATALNRDKYFSPSAPAAQAIPFLMKAKYPAADVGSAVAVTYEYVENRDAALASLSTASYVVSTKDYKTVWGGKPGATAFTDLRPAATNLPVLLAANFPSAVENDYKNVVFNYSAAEPTEDPAAKEYALEDEFDANSLTDGDWTLVTEGDKPWTLSNRSGDYYFASPSVFSDKVASKGWLISEQIDLDGMTDPVMYFKIQFNYYVGGGLSVLITTDEVPDTETGSWTDITSKFTNLPSAPGSGWTTLDIGPGDLSDYEDEKVYIAFVYDGDGRDGVPEKRTTTYQIYNVRIYHVTEGLEIDGDIDTIYDSWKFDGADWVNILDADTLMLQPADFAAMGVSFLTTAQAPTYIPTWLNGKYTYAQEGDAKTIIFRSSASNDNYADKYVFTNGAWTPQNLRENKTDQFVLSNIGWVFDPTFVFSLANTDYWTVVYYVRDNLVTPGNPNIYDTQYNNTEYYFGFNARYNNISFRESDRSKDTTYPMTASDQEKSDFMFARAVEGLSVVLETNYPTAQPTVNGVDQLAKITALIFRDPLADTDNVYWTFTFQCTAVGEWTFIERESENGVVVPAP